MRIQSRFILLTAVRWLPVGLVIPVLVLMLQARGLSLADVGLMLALYSVVTLLLELPTGGLADVLGRRPVIVASSLTSLMGLVVAGLAARPVLLGLAVILLAVGRALSSGPLEAWFVDEARAVDDSADIQPGLARAGAAEALSLGAGAVVGGALPAAAAALVPTLEVSGTQPLISLSAPFLLAALVSGVHAGLVLLMVQEGRRPRTRGDVAANIATTIRTGLTQAARGVVLRRVLLTSGAVGVVLSTLELLSPGAFAPKLGGAETGTAGYGVLVAVGFAVTAAGSLLAPRLGARLGGRGRAAALALLLAAPAALAVSAQPLPAAVTGYLVVYALLGAVGPLTSAILHDEVREEERSTALSVQSLLLQAGGAGASVGVGVLAEQAGLTAGFAVAAAACLIGAWLMGRPRPLPARSADVEAV
jgi:MFS family permease